MSTNENDSAYKVTPVFDANYQATERIIVNQGGTSSGKTYAILQVLFFKAIYEPGAVITVVGQDVPNLKAGAYRDAKGIWASSIFIQQFCGRPNETDRLFSFSNGSLIEFKSYADEQDAKSGKRDYLFVNEANGEDYMTYYQLDLRTRKKIYLDYNPSAPFWVHEKLIGESHVRLIISDHRHNTFLSKQQHDLIENIPDKELWRVYARGLTGNISGLIFPNWTPIEPEKFPDVDCVGGLDFGWVNDSTALVKVAKVGDSIFVKELAYEAGMDMRTIKQLIDANGLEQQVTYADHAPENIAELRRLGVNVLMARKGQGSIKAGILLMKSMKWFYTNDSKNLKEELKRYEWVKDKATGKSTNVPIDNFNHAIDAIRYAFYTHYFRG